MRDGLSAEAATPASDLPGESVRLKPGERVVVRAVPPFKPGRYEGRTGVLLRPLWTGGARVLFDDLEPCPTCKGSGEVQPTDDVSAAIVHPVQEVLL